MPLTKRASPTMPSGRTREPREAVAALAAQRAGSPERALVFAHPHRRDDTITIAEGPLGPFCIAMGLREMIHPTGVAYAELVGKWRGARSLFELLTAEVDNAATVH